MQAKDMGFDSVITVSGEAAVQGKKWHNKKKGKKGAEVAGAFLWAEAKAYTSVKLPLSREALIKVIVVSLEAANAALPSL